MVRSEELCHEIGLIVELSDVQVLHDVLAVHDVLIGLRDDSDHKVHEDDEDEELVHEPDECHQVHQEWVFDVG